MIQIPAVSAMAWNGSLVSVAPVVRVRVPHRGDEVLARLAMYVSFLGFLDKKMIFANQSFLSPVELFKEGV